MEISLGPACCGTYDDGNGPPYNILRMQAVRLAYLEYLLLRRAEAGICQCYRCIAERNRPLETEP